MPRYSTGRYAIEEAVKRNPAGVLRAPRVGPLKHMRDSDILLAYARGDAYLDKGVLVPLTSGSAAGLLGAAVYDPGTSASFATTTAAGLAAIDTTNLRKTVTPASSGPSSGVLMFRGHAAASGGATIPALLFGILESTTVVARCCPMGTPVAQATGNSMGQEFYAIVGGLSNASHTLDFAAGISVAVSSSAIKYGGLDDSSGPDAWGQISMEIYDPGPNYLGSILYDPTSVTTKTATALGVMTVFDTTNARVTLTAPASGNIFWRARAVYSGATSTFPSIMLGIKEGSNVVAREHGVRGQIGAFATATPYPMDASGVMTSVGAGSHTYDLCYQIQLASSASGNLKYGGPNSATQAFGALLMEFWAAS